MKLPAKCEESIKGLPSSKKMASFLATVIQEAKQGKAMLILGRKSEGWRHSCDDLNAEIQDLNRSSTLDHIRNCERPQIYGNQSGVVSFRKHSLVGLLAAYAASRFKDQ